MNNNNVTYFDSFGVEHIPKEIKAFIKNKNIKTNIFIIQAYDSVTYGYFCIGFIDFMFKGKTLTEYANIFFTKQLKKKWWHDFKVFYEECICIKWNHVVWSVEKILKTYIRAFRVLVMVKQW